MSHFFLGSVFNKNLATGLRFGVALVIVLPIIIAKYGHNARNGGFPIRQNINVEFAGDMFGNLRHYRPSVENMPQDWGRLQ